MINTFFNNNPRLEGYFKETSKNNIDYDCIGHSNLNEICNLHPLVEPDRKRTFYRKAQKHKNTVIFSQ